ncbi:MAG: peptidoglycan DD-metalloendopeptidase family protein, partial [Acidimicrobiia bacterium]|nr:peptidoglycan DD-metalloendopeptidase family protein [Acidimicrobiia bacterium]
PQRWDHDRTATWVTLKGTGENAAGTVSMVAVHHMIKPAKYGPNKPLRRQLYREGMEKIQDLVTTLSASGPVFVAGDFNSQWTANDPWGPRKMLGAVGMKTTMDVLGKESTHDGGGIIDYVFYQPEAATPTRQWTQNLNSDHNLLGAEFDIGTTSADLSGDRDASSVGRAGIETAADTDSDSEVAGEGLGLSATQWKRAAEVVGAGKSLGISEQGIVIALAVASQESGFKVYANDGLGGDLAADQRGISRSLRLPHDAVGTDHGSLGVFQQQWPWWGSMEELMDPATSSRKFYEALLKVPGWESLPLTVAAQEVQQSAYPDAYADDETLARQIYAKLANTPATDLYLASNELAECATQTVAAGGRTVVFPVPANLADTDRHNWGEAGSNWDSWHTGTDFSVPCGTPVLASHSGTVEIDTSQSWAGPQLVKVSMGPGQLTTWYAHMQKVLVAGGQAVTAGQQIGEVGEAGNATGCHLHFEVHTKGGGSIYGPDNVDPSTWLAENVGKTIGGGPGSFVIATFNTLGHSHTKPGGNKKGWADSATRTRWMAELMASQGPDVVGLQEFQDPQARVFHEVTGDTWGGFGNKDNVVIWRRGTFELASSDTVAIPYFGGHTRQMPLVRLRHLASGQVITVINVHNPADVHGPAAKWRAEAIARERTVIARERAAGYPVFLV